MEMIVPEILADAQQLSAALLVAGLGVGLGLWLAGWMSHRFWMVLGFTIGGGIWGLQNAALVHAQPLAAAIGIGMAAGILALTLVRLGAFAAGGYAGIVLARNAFPSLDQPLMAFLAGGFLGFLLLRYWTMALTSLAGSLLMCHCVLALLGKGEKLDPAAWAENNTNTLNVTCALVALFGFGVQLLIDWVRSGKTHDHKGSKKEAKKSKGDPGMAFANFRRAG